MTEFFVIPGEPRGKGRPRFASRGKYISTYTDEKTALYENLVKVEYQAQCSNKYFGDKLYIKACIIARYAIPRSVSKSAKEKMLAGIIRPAKKPDIDNIVKVIFDALNGIAYRDDSQIVECEIRKFYSDVPCVEVTLTGYGGI